MHVLQTKDGWMVGSEEFLPLSIPVNGIHWIPLEFSSLLDYPYHQDGGLAIKPLFRDVQEYYNNVEDVGEYLDGFIWDYMLFTDMYKQWSKWFTGKYGIEAKTEPFEENGRMRKYVSLMFLHLDNQSFPMISLLYLHNYNPDQEGYDMMPNLDNTLKEMVELWKK